MHRRAGSVYIIGHYIGITIKSKEKNQKDLPFFKMFVHLL